MQEKFPKDLENFHSYINFKRFKIHWIAWRFLVVPCAEAIEQIITHMDDSHLVLRTESGSHIATYYGEDMHTYYKMLKPNEYENENFYTRWATLDMTDVIKQLFQEPYNFFCHPSVIILKKILRDVYQCLMAMYYQIFQLKNFEVFQRIGYICSIWWWHIVKL